MSAGSGGGSAGSGSGEKAGRERRVLITGAGGLIGRRLTRALAGQRQGLAAIVALDVREAPAGERLPGVDYRTLDVCAPELAELIAAERIDTVVHLAAIVTPPPGCTREQQHRVDVGGTENLLAACAGTGVRRLIVTSSGAAYGYHADNAALLTEEAPLRGNPEFAYSDHKRIVEELLARHRAQHPELAQLVFRLGTVLGDNVNNQITALFEKPVVVGIEGSSSPFTLAWDEDVVACLAMGVHGEQQGIYNLVGDGVMTLREMAAALGKPYLAVPARALGAAIDLLQRAGKTRYGPEQVAFLRYRPVLSNDKLKREFGYRPKVSTREAFARYLGRSRRNVVITGAAGGIGRALAGRFAEEGCRVALLDLDGPALERAARELSAEGREVRAEQCDVRDAEQCRAAIDRVIAAWGGVDVLVNNAGVAHRSLLSETEPAVLRQVMDVNFFGAVNCTRAALASVTARRGVIVAVSSVAGFAPLVGRAGYAASKHALHGFFDSLRAEVSAKGVGVLLVCPSFTDTGIDAHALSGSGGLAGKAKSVVGKLAAPRDVAEAIVRAVRARKKLLVLSPVGKASYLLSRFAPALYAKVMRASQGQEFGL